MNKYIFHIPCVTYVDGEMLPNKWEQVVSEMAKQIYSFYLLDTTGYYKGRSYKEKLFVVYGEKNLIEIFMENVKILEQECYAFEMDNELFIREG